MTLTIGSCFSGIGGLELGLEMAGLGPVVWQCEIDPFARAVLAKHWPDVTRYNDVRSLNLTHEPECDADADCECPGDERVPRVDLICGGFPCTDISSAGQRAGIDGARSRLWFEFLRVIDALRPRYAVIENVSRLATAGLDRVIAGLSKSGYDAVWFPVRASDVGGSHRRERVFVVAYSDELGFERESASGLHADGAPGYDADRCGVFVPGPDDADAWREAISRGDPEPGLRRGPDGFPGGVDTRMRLGALGNAVVPACAAVAGLVIRGIEARAVVS